MESEQIGKIELFDIIEVECGDESFILQVLDVEGLRFIKYYVDEYGNACQGILVLDSDEIFKVGPEIVGLRKIESIPTWMRPIYIDCVAALTSTCVEIE